MVIRETEGIKSFPTQLQSQAEHILNKVFAGVDDFDRFMLEAENGYTTKARNKGTQLHHQSKYREAALAMSLLKELVHSMASGELELRGDNVRLFTSDQWRDEGVDLNLPDSLVIRKSRENVAHPSIRVLLDKDTWTTVLKDTPETQEKMQALKNFAFAAEREFDKANQDRSLQMGH